MSLPLSSLNNSNSAFPANIAKNLSLASNKPVPTVANNQNNGTPATVGIASDKFQQVGHLASSGIGVIDPPAISNNPEQAILDRQKSSDVYAKQENPAAIGLTPEQIQNGFVAAKNQTRNFFLGAAAVAVGLVAIVKGKSAPFLKSFFKKAEEQIPISTFDDIVKYKDELIGIAEKKFTDLQNIKVRLADKSTDDVRKTLKIMHESAIEMSNCKEAIPIVNISTAHLAENEYAQILKCIKEGKINHLSDEIVKKIEFAEVAAENGTVLNKGNDVYYEIHSRKVVDILSFDAVIDKFFNAKSNRLFKFFFS